MSHIFPLQFALDDLDYSIILVEIDKTQFSFKASSYLATPKVLGMHRQNEWAFCCLNHKFYAYLV